MEKKSSKRSGFVIYYVLKTVHLQQVKGMQSSKLVMSKGYNLFNRRYTKGVHFLSKHGIQKVKGLDLGASPYKTFLSPPGQQSFI